MSFANWKTWPASCSPSLGFLFFLSSLSSCLRSLSLNTGRGGEGASHDGSSGTAKLQVEVVGVETRTKRQAFMRVSFGNNTQLWEQKNNTARCLFGRTTDSATIHEREVQQQRDGYGDKRRATQADQRIATHIKLMGKYQQAQCRTKPLQHKHKHKRDTNERRVLRSGDHTLAAVTSTTCFLASLR